MPPVISLIGISSYTAIVGYWRATRRDSLIRSSAAAFISPCSRASKQLTLSTWFWIDRSDGRRRFAGTSGELAGFLIFICGGPPLGTLRSLWKSFSIQRRSLLWYRLSAPSYPGTRYAISAYAGDFAFFTCWLRSKSEHPG